MSAPTEDDMRTQMHNTMSALERMANAVTNHLTADAQPGERTAEFEPCGAIKNRSSSQPETYGEPCDNLNTVPCFRCGKLRCGSHLYQAMDGNYRCAGDAAAGCIERGKERVKATDWTKEEADYADELRISCAEAREALSGKKFDEGKDEHVFNGDVTVTGNLVVEGNVDAKKDLTTYGCTTTVETETVPGPMAPDGDLQEIRKTLDNHRKALALLATFGRYAEPHRTRFFGKGVTREVQGLVNLKACPDCVGSGWIARDETCKRCSGVGYES